MKKKAILIVYFVLCFCASFATGLFGCAAQEQTQAQEQENSPYSQIADYYSIQEVKDYHNDISDALNATVNALSGGDANALTTSLNKLDELCDTFIGVTDVPDALKPYHEKILEVAVKEKTYTAALRAGEYEKAADTLNEIFDELQSAEELLPQKEG